MFQEYLVEHQLSRLLHLLLIRHHQPVLPCADFGVPASPGARVRRRGRKMRG